MANTARLDDPGALGGVLTGVSFIGGLATGLSLADAPFPRPGADITDVQRFFQGDARRRHVRLRYRRAAGGGSDAWDRELLWP